jgi:hypothetical protein
MTFFFCKTADYRLDRSFDRTEHDGFSSRYFVRKRAFMNPSLNVGGVLFIATLMHFSEGRAVT